MQSKIIADNVKRNIRTESFKGVCKKDEKFSKTSLNDIRQYGIQAAHALKNLCQNEWIGV